MPQNKFFQPRGPFYLRDLLTPIQQEIGLATELDKIKNIDKALVTNIAGLKVAEEGEVSFCQAGKYRQDLRASRASVIFVTEDLVADVPQTAIGIVMKSPHLAYTLVGIAFYPRQPASQHSIHPTAIIDATANIATPVVVGAYAVIGAGAKIGKGCIIGIGTVIADGVEMGDNNIIGDHCSLAHCIMGHDCDIDNGVRIGGRGFGLALGRNGILRTPQIGKVVIGNGVGISCNSVIDRGAMDDTIIADNVQIDNMVTIGHNTHIQRSAIICSMVGVAGSVKIGTGAVLGGQVGVSDHINIGAGAKISAQSGVISHIEAGAVVGGTPAVNQIQYLRAPSLLKNLEKTVRDLKNLKKTS